ncbi:dsDNA nuclease domain-containing protein [Aeromonas hydrophila]|uniref:dsDNA nuclease domain-containing protein n=1 Tax=Aeromonas TaxID=642 RepID=UPI0022E36A4B|nr:ABC-three component system protein [Aeromonas sp. QDB01]
MNNTLADKTELGFEYQDLVFLKYLLNMKPSEKVGLEVIDDIHIDSVSNTLDLIQVKHSINSKNLSEKDIDLWKTLYNWNELIHKNNHYKEKNIKFIIFTSKGISNQPLMLELKKVTKDIELILNGINRICHEVELSEQKKDPKKNPNPIYKYTKLLSSSSQDNLRFIIGRLYIEEDNDTILNEIDISLSYYAVPPQKINSIRDHLLGSIKTFKFERILSGQKVEISYEEFRAGYINFNLRLQEIRTPDINIKRFYSYEVPENISFVKGIYVSQLKDIEITEEDINNYGMSYIRSYCFLRELIDNGEMLEFENNDLDSELKAKWRKIFRKNQYSNNSELERSRCILFESMDIDSNIRSTILPTDISNGKLIELSDKPEIGWQDNWESKYGH